ncbi:MAG: hypothetical protein ACRD1H_14225, partial [Vicinamibacterales bacterium]
SELRRHLIEVVLNASVVPSRPGEIHPAGEIADAALRGLGPDAERILSAHLERAAAGLVRLITDEQRKFTKRPEYDEVVEVVEFGPTRQGRAETSLDRHGAFRKGVGYSYRKSLYAQDWFDSSTERDVANILEADDAISLWARLQTGDLPILWATGRNYHPDFVAIDLAGRHWLIEVKMDKEMPSAEVRGKREAARRWANHVSADERVGVPWRYVLVSESDVRTARGSWEALTGLGGH